MALVTAEAACDDRKPGGAPRASLPLVWQVTGEYAVFSSPRLLKGGPGPDSPPVFLLGMGLKGDDVTGEGAAGALATFDARTGRLLRSATLQESLVGSPCLVELDRDGVPDVVIGGLRGVLGAWSTADGGGLWRFDPGRTELGSRRHNTYSPHRLSDVNGDGVDDVLVAHGGDPSKRPGAPRDAGHFLVLSGRDGKVIAGIATPDGAETYMSPLTYERDLETVVVVGTGGETHPGSLWSLKLADLLAGRAERAKRLVSPLAAKGVIAPPALVDVTEDSVHDIIVATFDGRLVAVDGQSEETVWTHRSPDSETYATPAVGYFDDDDVPDIYAAFDVGTWPEYGRSHHLVVSGRSGQLLWSRLDRRLVFSSPLVVDFDDDGFDEVLIVVMTRGVEMRNEFHTDDREAHESELVLVDPRQKTHRRLLPLRGFCPGTPWLGDLDDDGELEIAIAAFRFSGDSARWRFELRRLGPCPRRMPAWGAYLGSAYDGRFRETETKPAR